MLRSAVGRPRALPRPFVYWISLVGCLLTCLRAQAGDAPTRLTARAMPGVVTLALPAEAPRGFVLGTAVGAGYIEPIGEPAVDAARLTGSLAVAYAPIPELAFGLDFSGRLDFLSTPETNGVAEPRLTVRGVFLSSGTLRLGAEADVRFVGASAPSIDWAATSPSLAGLIAWVPEERSWIGGSVGFHWDRSAEVAPDPSALSVPDRITLGASSAPAVKLGVGVTHLLRAAPVELLGEFVAELLVGSSAPPIGQSPLRLTAGARYALTPRWSLLAAADLGLSARPSTLEGETLVPISPRIAGHLGVVWNLQPRPEAPPPVVAEPPPAPPPPPPPAVVRSSLGGRVVDEAGQGLPDVEVTLTLPEGAQSTRTFADGQFEFANVSDEARAHVRAVAPGFDPAEAKLEPGADRRLELVLYSAVPAGQVRGIVVDLSGRPVLAKITIEPGNRVLEVNPNGTFNIELAPGEYRLRAEHPDFAPQGRSIVVVERGVVILHIALTR